MGGRSGWTCPDAPPAPGAFWPIIPPMPGSSPPIVPDPTNQDSVEDPRTRLYVRLIPTVNNLTKLIDRPQASDTTDGWPRSGSRHPRRRSWSKKLSELRERNRLAEQEDAGHRTPPHDFIPPMIPSWTWAGDQVLNALRASPAPGSSPPIVPDPTNQDSVEDLHSSRVSIDVTPSLSSLASFHPQAWSFTPVAAPPSIVSHSPAPHYRAPWTQPYLLSILSPPSSSPENVGVSNPYSPIPASLPSRPTSTPPRAESDTELESIASAPSWSFRTQTRFVSSFSFQSLSPKANAFRVVVLPAITNTGVGVGLPGDHRASQCMLRQYDGLVADDRSPVVYSDAWFGSPHSADSSARTSTKKRFTLKTLPTGLPPPATSSSGKSSSLQAAMLVVVLILFEFIPGQIYLHFLLRIPSLYFSRRMARAKADQWNPSDDFIWQSSMPTPDQMPLPRSLLQFRSSWESFIDSLMREWKTFNIISVLLMSAILTMLQIEAASHPINPHIGAVVSHMLAHEPFASSFAKEAQKRTNSIWWNIWVLLAMPAVWLAWSIVMFLTCIMSFIWLSGFSQDPVDFVVSPRTALGPSIDMGDPLDREWMETVGQWTKQALDASHNPYNAPPPAAGPFYPSPRPATRRDRVRCSAPVCWFFIPLSTWLA
ncbi:hypothetical protein B0H14DRAFT_3446061 [Mycena olivaceomarginata]|nr:hypothetical protein B0H14DRAFT_3446061 [Mycena olivaceomarginata]